jgi:YfiH family protein
MSFKQIEIGFLFEDSDLICFFGNKNSNLEELKKQFPDLRFTRIHQVHGDGICESNSNETNPLQKADAHFTSDINTALCINTADCMPIMIYAEEERIALAIHAGWRGVANRILQKSLEELIKKNVNPKNIQIFIGPHIGFDSFEVDEPVKGQLLNSTTEPKGLLTQDLENNKFKVNLLELVRLQLHEFNIGTFQIEYLTYDTMTNSDFHSYRRDKENSGRQVSFIAMKDQAIARPID